MALPPYCRPTGGYLFLYEAYLLMVEYIKRQIPYPSDDDVVCRRLEPRIKVLSSLIWDKQYQSTEVRKFIEFLIVFLNK